MMKALRYINGSLTVDEVPLPSNKDEALVKVSLSGICNTDIEIVRGYAGFQGILGHEFVGVVESSNDRPDLIGKRVVGEINAGCGKCHLCLQGDPRHCPDRDVLGIVGRDGCHAEYLSLPAENLIEVPDSISDEIAVFAEPLAAADGISELAEIAKNSSVAVIGDGKLGLLCAMTANLRSNNVTLIGKHPEKMAIAENTRVSTIHLNDVNDHMHKMFDIVIESSGSESGFNAAIDLVKPRGMIVLKSTFHGQTKWAASRVVVDEITIQGSRCGRFSPAIELLRSGLIDVRPLISDQFSLNDGRTAMQKAMEKGVLKVLLRP